MLLTSTNPESEKTWLIFTDFLGLKSLQLIKLRVLRVFVVKTDRGNYAKQIQLRLHFNDFSLFRYRPARCLTGFPNLERQTDLKIVFPGGNCGRFRLVQLHRKP